MLVPLSDENIRRRRPVATIFLLVLNICVFLFQLSLTPEAAAVLVRAAGAIPLEVMTLRDLPPASLVPLPLTVLTSMFLHGGFLHLIGNMWFLWVFGDNVEDRLGPVRYLVFYLLTGSIGAFAQCFSMPRSLTPMIGASGAVAGVLGGYWLMFPHTRVATFLAIPFLWRVIHLRAWIFLGLWFLGQFLIGAGSGIAWMAHVGGFLGGLGLVRLFARDSSTSILTDAPR